jgi:hypothetical protein
VSQRLLEVYSGVVTLALVSAILLGARKPAGNAEFDQITVHRINIVEPDGTTRMVLADRAEFPGAFFKGKESPRTDRSSTGMIFNNDEGTENGGLIFGGSRDKDGVSHSYGHLSFDEYERDQTLVEESQHSGESHTVYYGINDDTTRDPLTPELMAEYMRFKDMPQGAARDAERKRLRTEHPGGLISRAFFGRSSDKSVSLSLKDQQGHERLVARVAADGTPELQFLDGAGKVVKTIDSTGIITK